MQHRSAWESSALPRFARLERDLVVDVCVIGAGIAGTTAAWLLARNGVSVLLMDARQVGAGETSHTTAHLSNAIDSRYFDIALRHGRDGARVVAASHTEAIRTIEANVAELGIDCQFRRVSGYLFVPPGANSDELRKELDAAQDAGLSRVQLLERAPETPFDTGLCLEFPDQGQFEPLRYLRGLVEAIERRGGRVAGETRAVEVQGGKDAYVRTEHGPVVRCRAVIVATNTPINDTVAIHTKQAPYRTYVVAFRLPRGSVRPALWWDTEDPYHYVRVHSPAAEHDLLIVGGEDHKTGQAQDGARRFARLEEWARVRYPSAQAVEYRWSGQVLETVDGLAFIGRNPRDHDNVLLATGDCGMGMTHGTIAGILLAELAQGRDHAWAKTYSPLRIPWRSAATFLKENLNVAAQYTDWLKGSELPGVHAVPPGGGAVLRDGMQKVAVHRAADGRVHTFSATCPHLGCVVAWNPTESSWDCPCHGSRFAATGEVVNGPANKGLTPVEMPGRGAQPGQRSDPQAQQDG